MGKPIDVEKRQELLRLAAEGHTCSEIGRRLAMDRHTVKMYVEAAEQEAEEARAAERSEQALVDFERAPAAMLTKSQVARLAWLAEVIELERCKCGQPIPLLGHIKAYLVVRCLRCGTWWEFGLQGARS